jgi:hypothetical protein
MVRKNNINLLGHDHGPEFAGHARRISTGHKNASEYRSQLTHHGKRNQFPDQVDGTEALQSIRALHGQHRTREESDQHHDGQRAHADQVGLTSDIRNVKWLAEKIGNGMRREQGVILNRQDLFFGDIRRRGEFHAVRKPASSPTPGFPEL